MGSDRPVLRYVFRSRSQEEVAQMEAYARRGETFGGVDDVQRCEEAARTVAKGVRDFNIA
jgi:hypothetical protein